MNVTALESVDLNLKGSATEWLFTSYLSWNLSLGNKESFTFHSAEARCEAPGD